MLDNEFYVRGKVNNRIYVRNFVQFNKKTLLDPPPSTPRTKRHLMCKR